MKKRKMSKRMLSIIIVAIVLFGASVPFAVVWLSTLGNPNRGRISGLSGARFVAHMDRGVYFVPEYDEFFSPIPATPKVVNSREELIEMHVNAENDWYNRFNELGWGDYFLDFDFGVIFRPEYYDSFFPEYNDEFFVTRQLIFTTFGGLPVIDYQVGSIAYYNNTLAIEFVTTRMRGPMFLPGASRKAIVEITRISDDFNIEVSGRLRWVRFPFWLW